VIIREIFADALLGLAAAIVLVSAAGVLVMRGAYDKLHFVTPAALVAPVLVTLAVLVYAGFSATTTETLLALLFMVIAGPFLTHATIRAARVRETGDWRPGRQGGTPSGKGYR
jgi:multisubunit Na+/H+ antiporter MnhG subunit